MEQSNSGANNIARVVHWSYRVLSEEAGDKDFFSKLEHEVATAIDKKLRGHRIWVGREMQVVVGSYVIHARLTEVEPPLANLTDHSSEFLAVYRARAKDEGQDVSTFLAEIIRYPNARLGASFEALVGIDDIKKEMSRKLTLLLMPGYIDEWAKAYGNKSSSMLVQALRDRYPLFILEGEVGSGKTALARSIGHRIAIKDKCEVALFVVNAQVRGGGHVGELTQNISRAFNEAERCQEREQIPVMLLIDEADALAQSRGGSQTHHEDDAGVNTLIQRIDRLRGRPMAVIFATNLAQSLDSAILRRAIASYHFTRPDDDQRADLFGRLLADINISERNIEELVKRTKPRIIDGFGKAEHRYTYSDLSQRIIPRAVEEAIYKGHMLAMEYLTRACETTPPTPEMRIPQ